MTFCTEFSFEFFRACQHQEFVIEGECKVLQSTHPDAETFLKEFWNVSVAEKYADRNCFNFANYFQPTFILIGFCILIGIFNL